MLKSITIHVLTPYYQSIFLLFKNIKKVSISYYRGNKNMKVKNSNILLSSTREHTKELHFKKRLNIWNNSAPKEPTKPMIPTSTPDKNIKAILPDHSSLEPKFQALKLILEALTGKKINIVDAPQFEHNQTKIIIKIPSSEPVNTQGIVGWGIDYQENKTISETEQSVIMASGLVKTKDGRDINFSLCLSMAREFQTSLNFSFKAGDALIDPLVINLDSNATNLKDTRFKFDINSDGSDENIPWLKGSNGFLVFDRNKDGVINNGTELFGPKTGDGFSELSELDYDNNGFIDESDPDFKNLMVWSGKAYENSKLMTLKYHDIAAIGLVNVNSEFSLKNSTNNTLGQVKKTGIYLRENGQAGTIQQIDLSV